MTAPDSLPLEKTAAQKLEALAFTFCKAAVLVLLFGRFSLPMIAGLAAVFYFWAYAKGKRDSRCFLKFPLLIGCVWTIVVVIWCLSYFQVVTVQLPWFRSTSELTHE